MGNKRANPRRTLRNRSRAQRASLARTHAAQKAKKGNELTQKQKVRTPLDPNRPTATHPTISCKLERYEELAAELAEAEHGLDNFKKMAHEQGKVIESLTKTLDKAQGLVEYYQAELIPEVARLEAQVRQVTAECKALHAVVTQLC